MNGAYRYSPQQAELIRIYDVYRTVRLNVHYYGRRVTRLTRWHLGFQIAAAVGTSATLGMILWASDHRVWLIVSAGAAIAATVAPLFGLAAKISQRERLHLAYNVLSQSFEHLVHEIKSRQEFLEEHRSAAAILSRQYEALASFDEPDPSRRLIEKCTSFVSRELPPGTFWLPRQRRPRGGAGATPTPRTA